MPSVDSATMSTVAGLLKNVYLSGITNIVNNPNAFLAEIEKSEKDIVVREDMQGAKAVFAIQTAVSQAVGARGELVALPAPQRTLVRQAEANLKFVYGVIRLTGPLLASAKTNKQAFARALDSEINGIKLSMRLDLNRQVWGDGTGLVATCGTTTASLTVQLAADANMNYFQVGMIVDLKTISTGVNITDGDSREIESVDVANKTITLLTGGNVVTTDSTTGVYREDAYNQELTGLDKIVDGSGTLFNINPSTAGNERWVAHEQASWGAFGIDKLQEEIDTVHDNSGEWITHLFSQAAPRQKYLNALTAERRMAVQQSPQKLNGGFKGLAYTGGGDVDAVWVKDPFTQPSRIYGLSMKDSQGEPIFEFRKQKEFDWMEVNGATLLPEIYGTTGVDAYKSVLCTYAEIICKKRNAQMKLLGVS